MPAKCLPVHRVAKPWGRRSLWPGFPDAGPDGDPIGEIWFQSDDADAPLLIKYLFTSERLSIQVHPDDTAARAAGYPCGKDEAWVILDTEPGATIALGLKQPTTRETLHAAAIDGTIETLVDWKPVQAGDTIYSGAGTVHAIGAGLTLIEVQQNVDLTYRLYDYGRPRALHLDAGVAVADPVQYVPAPRPRELGDGRMLLIDGPKFVLERWHGGSRSIDAVPGTLFVPVSGGGKIDAAPFTAGECWAIEDAASIELEERGEALLAYPGAAVR